MIYRSRRDNSTIAQGNGGATYTPSSENYTVDNNIFCMYIYICYIDTFKLRCDFISLYFETPWSKFWSVMGSRFPYEDEKIILQIFLLKLIILSNSEVYPSHIKI